MDEPKLFVRLHVDLRRVTSASCSA
ncbi:putative leader peptide [Saccharopolyspora sp. NPDC049426]